MKKLILFLVAAVLAVALYAASTPADQRTVLSATTKNGLTTTLYIGRVQCDPAADGTCVLQVFPDQVLADNTGAVIARPGFSVPINVPLTAQQYAAIAGIIQAAYAAQNP
jgi:nitrogenase subunit NifH